MAKSKINEDDIQFIFTSELVEDATEKLNNGVLLKRYQNPWLKGEVGIKRTGVSFKMSPEEQEEYVRCALDIHYFTEKYCKTKREDGSFGSIKLRDYQKEILDNFTNHRYNILMSSRQSGKCNVLTTKVLCEIIGDDGISNVKEYSMYKLLFIYKNNKTIFDYIKYSLYSIINFLQKK